MRAPHTVLLCPKRVKANSSEYSCAGFDAAVAQVSAALEAQRNRREALEREHPTLITTHGAEDGGAEATPEAARAETARAVAKEQLAQLAGALNVVHGLRAPPPQLPAAPPAPPSSGRRDAWLALERPRRFVAQRMAKFLAAEVATSEVADGGTWAELRAIHLMSPQASTLRVPSRVPSKCPAIRTDAPSPLAAALPSRASIAARSSRRGCARSPPRWASSSAWPMAA